MKINILIIIIQVFVLTNFSIEECFAHKTYKNLAPESFSEYEKEEQEIKAALYNPKEVLGTAKKEKQKDKKEQPVLDEGEGKIQKSKKDLFVDFLKKYWKVIAVCSAGAGLFVGGVVCLVLCIPFWNIPLAVIGGVALVGGGVILVGAFFGRRFLLPKKLPEVKKDEKKKPLISEEKDEKKEEKVEEPKAKPEIKPQDKPIKPSVHETKPKENIWKSLFGGVETEKMIKSAKEFLDLAEKNKNHRVYHAIEEIISNAKNGMEGYEQGKADINTNLGLVAFLFYLSGGFFVEYSDSDGKVYKKVSLKPTEQGFPDLLSNLNFGLLVGFEQFARDIGYDIKGVREEFFGSPKGKKIKLFRDTKSNLYSRLGDIEEPEELAGFRKSLLCEEEFPKVPEYLLKKFPEVKAKINKHVQEKLKQEFPNVPVQYLSQISAGAPKINKYVQEKVRAEFPKVPDRYLFPLLAAVPKMNQHVQEKLKAEFPNIPDRYLSQFITAAPKVNQHVQEKLKSEFPKVPAGYLSAAFSREQTQAGFPKVPAAYLSPVKEASFKANQYVQEKFKAEFPQIPGQYLSQAVEAVPRAHQYVQERVKAEFPQIPGQYLSQAAAAVPRANQYVQERVKAEFPGMVVGRTSDGKPIFSTTGDGFCFWHAMFGQITSDGTSHVTNVREMARSAKEFLRLARNHISSHPEWQGTVIAGIVETAYNAFRGYAGERPFETADGSWLPQTIFALAFYLSGGMIVEYQTSEGGRLQNNISPQAGFPNLFTSMSFDRIAEFDRLARAAGYDIDGARRQYFGWLRGKKVGVYQDMLARHYSRFDQVEDQPQVIAHLNNLGLTTFLGKSLSAIQGIPSDFDPNVSDIEKEIDRVKHDKKIKVSGTLKDLEDELGAKIDAISINEAFGDTKNEFNFNEIEVIIANQPSLATNFRIKGKEKTRLVLVIDKVTYDEAIKENKTLALKFIIENELFQLRLKAYLDYYGLNSNQIREIETMSLLYMADKLHKKELQQEEIEQLQKLIKHLKELTFKTPDFNEKIERYEGFLALLGAGFKNKEDLEHGDVEGFLAAYKDAMKGYIGNKENNFSEVASKHTIIDDVFDSDMINALRSAA